MSDMPPGNVAKFMDPAPSCMVEKPMSPIDPEFLDTGVVIGVSVPYNINFKKLSGVPNAGNLPILFALRVSDRIIAPFDGFSQSIITCSPDFWLENSQITVDATLATPINFRRARTFRAWRGGIQYMFQLSANSVLQGSIAFSRVRNVPSYNMNGYLIDMNAAEPDSLVTASLANDRIVLFNVPYNETTECVDEMMYVAMRRVPKNVYSLNEYRSYIVVRANTPLSTFNGAPSILYFKIWIKYGPDFEWLYPISPISLVVPGYMASLDQQNPFAFEARLILTGWNFNFTIINVYWSMTSTNYVLTDEAITIPQVPNRIYWYKDTASQTFITPNPFSIQASVTGDHILLVWDSTTRVDIASTDFRRGLVILTLGANEFDTAPEYPEPPPVLLRSVEAARRRFALANMLC